MSELPVVRFNLGNGKGVEATPLNSRLYMHMGNAAMYDHIFLESEDQAEEGTTKGDYLFVRTAIDDPKTISQVALYMINSGYEAHLNVRNPAKCDIEAFEKMMEQQTSVVDEELERLLDEGTSDS